MQNIQLSRREMLRWLSMSSAAIVVAACAPPPAPSSGAGAQAAPTKAAKVESQTPGFQVSPPEFNKNAKTVLVFLNAGTSQVESMHQNRWVDQWNKANADVQIDLQYVAWADLPIKQQAYLSAGTPPDLTWYCGATARELYQKGWTEPLDDHLSQAKGRYVDELYKSGSPSMSPDNQHWLGAPFCMYGEGMVVRKDVFAKAGVEDLSALKTWDGWRDAVKKVHKPPEMYGYQYPQHPDMLTYTASRYFNSNGLAHLADFRDDKKDAYIEALEFIKSMLEFSHPAAKAWRHGDEIAAWTAGNIASMGTGSYFFGDIIPTAPKIATRENMAAMAFPHGSRLKNNMTPIGFCGYAMFKDSQHKPEAAKFLDFYASCDADNEFPMNMSPCKNVDIDYRVNAYKMYSPEHYSQVRWWFEDWAKIMETADKVYAEGYIPSQEIDKVWADNFPSWAYEGTSTKDAYETLKAQITPILKNPPT
ncbi:MAG: extracellular solute-binding protein [Caldilineaceae bacterium]